MSKNKEQVIEKMELELRLGKRVEGVKCSEVRADEIAGSLKLGGAMVQFCAEQGGAGLSGPQVGFAKQIIVWSNGKNMFQVGFNPLFYKNGKKIHTVEGCLSYPNEQYYISRWKYVIAVYEVPNKEKDGFVKITRKIRDEEAIVF